MLTVLTLFSGLVLTLIILVTLRPSRENAISMPSVRRNVCARRSRPASARRFFVHDAPEASPGGWTEDMTPIWRLWICRHADNYAKRRAGFASAPPASSAQLLSILRSQEEWLDRLEI